MFYEYRRYSKLSVRKFIMRVVYTVIPFVLQLGNVHIVSCTRKYTTYH